MAKLPRISASEWEIMNLVWEHAPITIPALCEMLPATTEWHPKTVGTFLSRLVAKGALAAERQGKTNVYTPLVTREACVREESTSFLKRVFRGEPAPMLLHFAKEASLTKEEIAEIERILNQRKKKK